MIMCVLLCYPVSIHMSQLQATGRPISSSQFKFHQFVTGVQILVFVGHKTLETDFEILESENYCTDYLGKLISAYFNYIKQGLKRDNRRPFGCVMLTYYIQPSSLHQI